MVKWKGLQVLEERINTIDPDKNEIHTFDWPEKGDEIKTKNEFERSKSEFSKKVKVLNKTDLMPTSSRQ